jgi:1,4-alpha-glucan branching enzyme
MLFMGEEYGTMRPFPFFCDFEPELAEAVRNGRRNEFAKFPEFQDAKKRDTIPDPTSAETFMSSKLDWDSLQLGEHRDWLDFYKDLVATRHAEIIPLLPDTLGHSGRYELLGDRTLHVTWQMKGGRVLYLRANLKPTEQPIEDTASARQLWSNYPADTGSMPGWGVSWSIWQGHEGKDVVS